MKFDLVWRLGWLLLGPGALAGAAFPASPDFNGEVRPILSRHCFKCHGPDDRARKFNLRLDLREAALKSTKSGKIPVVPGQPDQSELIARIYSLAPETVMPPPSTKSALTEKQKQILRQWVAAGADYVPHWAFLKPRQSPLPAVQHVNWPRNAIDNFILARLESQGLTPSPPAPPYTLVRRVYLDLLGFPPTPEEADDFVYDSAPDAYEKLVDRLLASPHYGERWARKWLDLARYADTNGYEKDRQRSIWPWRDWVIKALNADLPFDRFTVEQIAGDLLPQATPDQIIATGFHRNTMLNEEGGIDPLEFRFHAMTDRMATTGKTWLGLTIQCAQCHTHKYDPIPHREYYQMLAFLNNTDEPEYEVRPADYEQRRAEVEAKVAQLESGLTNRFQLEEIRWEIPAAMTVTATSGQQPESLPDRSWLFAKASAPTDTYQIVIHTELTDVAFIRLEAMAADLLPQHGPGRSDGGNFVLNEFTVSRAPRDRPTEAKPVKIAKATANYSQDQFDIAGAIDGDPKTGWAIAGSGKNSRIPHVATFAFAEPLAGGGDTTLVIRMEQNFGERHTIGHFRLSLGIKLLDERPIEVRRREALENKFIAWLEDQAKTATHWTRLQPVEATANLPLLTVLDDQSVLASGDQTKSDSYRLRFRTEQQEITAIRLEALADARLPGHGPGRVYYEGPLGDFNLSDFRLIAGGKKVAFRQASHSYAAEGSPASNAIDQNLQTGWAIDGGQGRSHSAVFNLAEPLAQGGEFDIQMFFEKYFPAGLGRFRISVTSDLHLATAHDLPGEMEELLAVPAAERAAIQRERLFQYFLTVAPELAEARVEIAQWRKRLAGFPTTLVMTERPPENPRPTFIHHRGEFLQPTERVEPAVLSVLNPPPGNSPRTRLEFARWLVSPDHPLTARVTVNRQWAVVFGRGLVRTVDDFGYQGDPPSHPELLDWLAVEFIKEGWSLKKLHRLMVLSATYRQSAQVTPELLAIDPANTLLARGPRVRLEAEMIRDSLLRTAGLLATNLGGPSVFPPQPATVTTEGTYGPLTWKVSEGADRYRRGLYTFSKRTAPYAMFSTFDGPSGETCVAQREVSDTPLQALTLLNDLVITEAAQALGRVLANQDGPVEVRVERLFRRCLTRNSEPGERRLLIQFFTTQKQRFETREIDAAAIAGPGPGDLNERAAWTALARALLNLDEVITKG